MPYQRLSKTAWISSLYLRDLFSQVYSRKNAYCLEYSRNIYHTTYSEYFGAVIRLFLLSQLQDLQYCSDREPVSQPVSPSVYPFHLLIVLSYKQKLKKGFKNKKMQILSLLKLVSVSCSFFFFSMSKSSIPWIMPLEFYHSFCIVWIPLQHKHLVLTIFVYYLISVDNQLIEHTVQVGAVLELITV